MRSRVAFASSSAVPPGPPPRRPSPPRIPDGVKPVSSTPTRQEKEQQQQGSKDPRRRDALLGAAFSALATAGLAGDRASLAAATTTPSAPPPPPAGWSYASKGKDWSSLGFESCGATGQQSPINISPPFSRIRRGGGSGAASRRERQQQQEQQQQQPFLELEADYRSAAFDAVVERGLTASPKFTVVAGKKRAGGGAGRREEDEEERHPAGGISLLDSETGERVFYPLVQFHFHRPGEEALEGRRGVLGAHLVHERESGGDRGGRGGASVGSDASPSSSLLPRFVVVAVAFDLSRRGTPDAALAELFGEEEGEDEGEAAGEGGEEGAPSRRVEAFDPSRLLPQDCLAAPPASSPSPSPSPGRRLTNFFAFEGSLTTPPCTKGARFYFAKGRRAATPGQVSRAVLPRGAAQNARPLQERGGRVVWEG